MSVRDKDRGRQEDRAKEKKRVMQRRNTNYMKTEKFNGMFITNIWGLSKSKNEKIYFRLFSDFI